MVLHRNPLFIRPVLVRLLRTVFRKLWRRAKEDALQELRLVELGCEGLNGSDTFQAALQSLSWLEYELGYRADQPSCPKPTFPPAGDLVRGSFVSEIDDVLEVECAPVPAAKRRVA